MASVNIFIAVLLTPASVIVGTQKYFLMAELKYCCTVLIGRLTEISQEESVLDLVTQGPDWWHEDWKMMGVQLNCSERASKEDGDQIDTYLPDWHHKQNKTGLSDQFVFFFCPADPLSQREKLVYETKAGLVLIFFLPTACLEFPQKNFMSAKSKTSN